MSLVPHLFEGAEPPDRDLFWRMRGQRALRRGDWKYVSVPGDDGPTTELYDLAADPSEQANLAGRRPEVAAELAAAWEAIDAGLLPYP